MIESKNAERRRAGSIRQRSPDQASRRALAGVASPRGGPHLHNRDMFEVPVKTQGEMEAAICEGVTRFEQEYMGRKPKDIRAHLLGDLLVVRLRGVLTSAEQHLVKTHRPEKGRDLLKQVRSQLMETGRPLLEVMVEDVTGARVLSLHYDVSTVTGEEVILFTLAAAPEVRAAKPR